MYIRRKVFSILTNKEGEERLYSVNETLIQKEFGAHKRKQNARLKKQAEHIEINARKAQKAAARAEKEMARGNFEAAEKAAQKAQRHATQSNATASRVSQLTDKIAKTRTSVDSAEGLNIKTNNKLDTQQINLKRDLPKDQTTITNTVTSKHREVPTTGEKVTRRTTTVVDRTSAPTSTANPNPSMNTITNKQANEARQRARNLKKQQKQAVTVMENMNVRGGVNGKPVEVITTKTEVPKLVEEIKNLPARINSTKEVAKTGADVTHGFTTKPQGVKVGKTTGSDYINKISKSGLGKKSKIAIGVGTGLALAGGGAYLYNKRKRKEA